MAESVVVLRKITAPIWQNFEPIGWQYMKHMHTVSNGLDNNQSSDAGNDDLGDNETNPDEEFEGGENIDHSSLDPTQWKDQDHYAVLGLAKSRYKASPKDIRKAYQQMALTHHPDKQETKGDDTLFKCIQVAYEILSDPKKRRGYDSVDPLFVETVPKQSAGNSSDKQFYTVFGPVFESNARWSIDQPVPTLGGPEADLEYVDNFYSFWYEFNSWREFSYLDEENTEKAENRDERRWMEKQNKAARQKRKKEETIRIRSLVDNAYACDPRVKKFKEMKRNEKEAQKRAKEQAIKEEAKKREDEKKRKLEEEKERKEKLEAEERRIQSQQKQEREAVKKALKKERKRLRTFCKDKNYFSSTEAETVDRMQQVERLCDTLMSESLMKLNEELLNNSDSIDDCKALIEREMAILREKDIEEERKQEEARQKAAVQKGGASAVGGASGDWNREEVQLLIKAVNLYPAGTARRWIVIAEYINQHVTGEVGGVKTPEQVIAKVKNLKKLDAVDKDVENTQAFSNFKDQQATKTSKGVVSAAPTTRDVGDVSKPWTANEQKLLEGALRSYPASTPKRWDRIAEAVPTRTKEECMARFKELVAKVKSKKQ